MLAEYPPALRGRAEWLALGFGTTVAMWAVGYLCRLPLIGAPTWLAAVLMLVVMLLGGMLAGRYGANTIFSGLRAGLCTAVLNLLILGGLLSSGQRSVAEAITGVILFLAFGALVGAAGAWLGKARRRPELPPADFSSAFAFTAAGATLLLLLAGGLVTSSNSGLAVVDWPNSQGFFMFLYPLSRMTGGIYYEHAHRLLGSLVGLTVLALALHLSWGESRRWVKGLAWSAFALVVAQGILGGMRVTGHPTLSTAQEAMRPSLLLAAVHGVVGQIIFALICALAVVISRNWRRYVVELRPASLGTDVALAGWLIPIVVVQVALGAVLRHYNFGLHLHITVAVVVLVFGLMSGVRLWGQYEQIEQLKRMGLGLVHLLGTQLVLGFAAWIAVGAAGGNTPAYMVIIATLHQTVGALILAWITGVHLWTRRVAGSLA